MPRFALGATSVAGTSPSLWQDFSRISAGGANGDCRAVEHLIGRRDKSARKLPPSPQPHDIMRPFCSDASRLLEAASMGLMPAAGWGAEEEILDL
jgi:hypothetical protein